MKTCGHCHEAKPLEAYGRDRSRKGGLQCWCRECCIAYGTTRYAANPEKKRARQSAWLAANPDYQAEWRAANPDYDAARRAASPERTKASSTARYAANPARTAAYSAAWHAANPLCATWSNMVQRCTNTKRKDYPNYGGRGITVCERWLTYKNWLTDILGTLGPRPEGMSMDRIDNDMGYFPGNVRWATRKQQSNNRRPRKTKAEDVRP